MMARCVAQALFLLGALLATAEAREGEFKSTMYQTGDCTGPGDSDTSTFENGECNTEDFGSSMAECEYFGGGMLMGHYTSSDCSGDTVNLWQTMLQAQFASNPLVTVHSDWPSDGKLEGDGACTLIVDAKVAGQTVAAMSIKVEVTSCPMPWWLIMIIVVLVLGVVGVAVMFFMKIGPFADKDSDGSDSG
jgi:hypothetical protein